MVGISVTVKVADNWVTEVVDCMSTSECFSNFSMSLLYFLFQRGGQGRDSFLPYSYAPSKFLKGSHLGNHY